jgi:hypothetical protein
MGPQAHFENRLEMWSLQDSKRSRVARSRMIVTEVR